MIKGLDVFRHHFEHYAHRYVLIGGVAATLAMEEAGLDFRATKDIDLVLVVEAMDVEFGQHFWQTWRYFTFHPRSSMNGALL